MFETDNSGIITDGIVDSIVECLVEAAEADRDFENSFGTDMLEVVDVAIRTYATDDDLGPIEMTAEERQELRVRVIAEVMSGGRQVARACLATATTLEDLRDVLNGIEAALHDARHVHGCTGIDEVIDIANLPTFGGDDVFVQGAFSWNEKSVLSWNGDDMARPWIIEPR